MRFEQGSVQGTFNLVFSRKSLDELTAMSKKHKKALDDIVRSGLNVIREIFNEKEKAKKEENKDVEVIIVIRYKGGQIIKKLNLDRLL